MRIPLFLHLSFFHWNGVVQEVSEDASSSEESQPIEAVQVQEPVIHPQQDNRSVIIEELERIEELILADLGVVDARVSVKTNAERARFIQIVVLATSRYKGRKQFTKLERRLTSQVSARIGIPRPHVQIRKMRVPSRAESLPE